MTSYERRLEIFDILRENKTVDVNRLADHFGVSTMTIRRDLATFEKEGLITTTYGGAVLNREVQELDAAPSLQSKVDLTARKIGSAACRLLTNGDTVFLDTGSLAVAAALSMGERTLTVVTNSLDAANVLRNFPRVRLIIAPGVFNDVRGGMLGSHTISFLRQFHFDATILCGEYLDTSFGLSVEDETDAHLKATAIDCAASNIILINGQDLGRTAFAQAVAWRRIQSIITDENADPAMLDAIEKRGVDVEIAK